MNDEPNLVGEAEIAVLLGVRRGTVDKWRTRKVMPAPYLVVSGSPIWRKESILAWARETNRLPETEIQVTQHQGDIPTTWVGVQLDTSQPVAPEVADLFSALGDAPGAPDMVLVALPDGRQGVVQFMAENLGGGFRLAAGPKVLDAATA